MDNVGNSLKSYFKEKRISQQRLAEILGCSQAQVSQYFNGKVNFGRQQAQKWQELFGINAAWLLTGEGEMLAENAAKTQNYFSIDASGDKIETSGENSPALGRGAVLATSDASLLQAENAHLREQLKIKDGQIAALQKIIDKLTS